MVNFLAVASIVFSAVAATPSQSQWQADYGKALAATRNDDRPLLIVLDVPADKELAVKTERLKAEGEQGKLLNAYQLCHVDASTKYGKKVAEVFKAEKFPFAAVIDKTGSVVLTKKTGQLSDKEWETVLETYKAGERSLATLHTTAYRGGMFDTNGSSVSVSDPSYCPSCQLRAQQN